MLGICFLLSGMGVAAESSDVQKALDEIIEFKLKQGGYSSVQQWIDSEIAKNALSQEWYAIAISQYGDYDLSKFESALSSALKTKKVAAASSRQKFALALAAASSNDSFITSTLNDSIGNQGVMSWIFGLNLLNNGYKSDAYSLEAVKQKLLSLQLSDGGWAVSGKNGDADATAMAIQALSPYYKKESAVTSAVDKGIAFLSKIQKENGDYSSYGVNNAESTAQVIIALSSLGIDPFSDERFIKNGKTLLDGILLYRLSDGGYCHKADSGYNSTATVQALCAFVAYKRMCENKPYLYMLDNARPEDIVPSPTPNNTQSSAISVTSSNTEQSSAASVSSASSVASQISSDEQNEEPQSNIEPSNSQKVSDEASSEPLKSTNSSKGEKRIGYKLWVSLAVALMAFASVAVLLFAKKRSAKNIIAVIIAAAAVIAFVCLTDFSSVSEHNNVSRKQNAIGTVELCIDCSKIKDKSAEHIPDDGVLLANAEYELESGETVYDILLQATKQNGLHLETDGNKDSVYINGIGNIYEFDHGELSGWIYTVNGEQPSESCGKYTLSPDDKIQFIYSLELGKDAEV